MNGKPFTPTNQPVHDRAAAARKAKTPWRRFPGQFKRKRQDAPPLETRHD